MHLLPRTGRECIRARFNCRVQAYNSAVITGISSVSVVVSDQDRSLAFYTQKLGFELLMDAPMGQSRWIQLAPKGAQTSLVLAKPTDDMPAEIRERVQS